MHTIDPRISDMSDIDSLPFKEPMQPRANRHFRRTRDRRK